MLEFSIITISTFVTMLDNCVKYFGDVVLKKDLTRYLPIFSVIFGIILGIAGYYTPDVEMGKNLIEAVFIGISAGSAATGVHQIGKQLYKKNTVDVSQLLLDTNDDTKNEISDTTDSSITLFAQSTTDTTSDDEDNE